MLAGPQGTLYGASSQAGTIRTITNKPDATEVQRQLRPAGQFVESGDAGLLVEGYVNIPITESTAIRLVGWYEHSPGYIDNVEGLDDVPDVGHHDDELRVRTQFRRGQLQRRRHLRRSGAAQDRPERQLVDHAGRHGAGGQNSTASIAYDPGVGDLELTHFFTESSEDTWVQASLTVEGKIGNFDLVYAGAYLDRNVDTRSDYSDYSYWYDVLRGYGVVRVQQRWRIINPAQYIRGKDGYKMWSNELRYQLAP